MAKQVTETFLAHAPMEKLRKQQKRKAKESWLQFMHNQLTCIHKLFVYYTGYKTGPMRQQFFHWSFGIVHVDTNAPQCRITPNTWSFHGHHPWLRRRTNAPSAFYGHAKSWANTLGPGSMLSGVLRCLKHIVFLDDMSSIKMLDRKTKRCGKPQRGIYGEVTVNNVRDVS
ncbi:hypothetical protein PsorP6_015419 [Peronosclerospora sorghi]|uniref:Uncharacterized protein n=1 Tax=Peronosclerospora sorghi TaxID=230839 RepID=A0ACC0WRM4_9STRA|nr:hypothetical protein PsorP6_015419 [Peronosclerospora sorghi]